MIDLRETLTPLLEEIEKQLDSLNRESFIFDRAKAGLDKPSGGLHCVVDASFAMHMLLFVKQRAQALADAVALVPHESKMESKALAWDEIAGRLDEVQTFLSRNRIGRLGHNVWHELLDYAIKAHSDLTAPPSRDPETKHS